MIICNTCNKPQPEQIQSTFKFGACVQCGFPLFRDIDNADNTESHLNLPQRIHEQKYISAVDVIEFSRKHGRIPRKEDFDFDLTSRESFLKWRNAIDVPVTDKSKFSIDHGDYRSINPDFGHYRFTSGALFPSYDSFKKGNFESEFYCNNPMKDVPWGFGVKEPNPITEAFHTEHPEGGLHSVAKFFKILGGKKR